MRREIRPAFHLDVSCPPEQLGQHLTRRLKSKTCPISGLVAPGRIELHVHGAEQHLWSPQLILEVVESEEGSELRGRFGPHPSVWTLFMAGYATCGLLGLLGLSFGLAQLTLETTAWGFWGIGLAGVLACLLSGFAYLGQGLGHTQMDRLRAFLEETLEAAQLPFRPSAPTAMEEPPPNYGPG